ncbi:hypothetical protein D8770_14335 [Methylobacterium sp. DB1607]|nr:hypothetical protein [Methylobacterium sp. DB1607]
MSPLRRAVRNLGLAIPMGYRRNEGHRSAALAIASGGAAARAGASCSVRSAKMPELASMGRAESASIRLVKGREAPFPDLPIGAAAGPLLMLERTFI